jgi:hypothetical protein
MFNLLEAIIVKNRVEGKAKKKKVFFLGGGV